MLHFSGRTEDETADSGAETAGSDCSKMSCSSIDLMAVPDQEPLPVTVHLLTNPGDSLLLQHTLDRLLKWVRPGFRLFHVSERACPLRDYGRADLRPAAGYPSHAVTLFLHESYGEERILRVLDFLQCPPWQYHHTESCGGRAGGIHISSAAAPSNALLRPYLLPSRDFYSLGVGMPVWGVRPVHYGGEVVRVTLHSTYDNFEDMVRLYETVLQRRAEEQKTGFCWFTLLMDGGFSLQLALKQLSPGVRVERCHSAVLQFRVGEIGQLVPLLPNTCSPISATRWHTEDLDGNKILFQVKGSAQLQGLLTSAFPLSCPNLSSRTPLRSCASTRPPSTSPRSKLSQLKERTVGRCRVELPLDRALRSGACAGESMGSDSTCSTPPGSSCYSSQRSSPAGLSANPYDPVINPETSISRLLLEDEEPETNVDTGCAVTPWPEQPTAVGASALESLSRDLKHGLPESQWIRTAQESTERIQTDPGTQTQAAQCHNIHQHAQVDEFFI
ncbi:protein FAM124B isoform X1 [Myxocyprinus asiaticus]|uniref:protein FAM124B isoform X1 n=2 Tax=Myxocyprinus asiaticus TaxID=70543 RepID=UPI0022227076|nr:protein FAM124B isoform X1 [Myxocyprinus asiaticus]